MKVLRSSTKEKVGGNRNIDNVDRKFLLTINIQNAKLSISLAF
jgi:hypothetical protein